MTRHLHPGRLDLQSFAQRSEPLVETTPLQNMKRLAHEAQGLQPDLYVTWQARAESRPRTDGDEELWLHLLAKASIPLICQRCMAVVAIPLDVNQWYRFVANEDIAMAEDDQSEEDLLVMAPLFDLIAVLEDELLMALPLVPMHDECPVAPVLRAGAPGITGEQVGKSSPFAVLGQLKKKK